MENTETTTLATVATIMSNQPGTSICSIKPDGNKETAKVVFNAMNNPTHKLADFVNKKICVQNYLIEIVEMADEDTGAVSVVPRTVLIAPDGESYMANSKGIFNSVRNAVNALGDAPWGDGIEFEVKQQPVGKGKMLTLVMV